MPSLFTHYDIGQKTLNILNKKIQNEINKYIDYYNYFNQGWDNMYYLQPFNSNYRKLGVKSHKKNVPAFFCNMVKFIKNNNLEDKNYLSNTIYGFMNHYITDTIIHPYINYQVKNLGIPHTKMEFMLDRYINKNITKKDFKTVTPKIYFYNELINMLDYTFLNTHGEKNIGKRFNKGRKNGYYLHRYFGYDKHGFKSKFYKILYIIPIFKRISVSDLTYYKNHYFDERILNKEKISWHHPNNENEKYNYSLEELFEITIKIAKKVNTEIYNVIHKNGDINKLYELIDSINLKSIGVILH